MKATSRERLLAAARTMFAAVGYEQASTAAIAREAGTSESQLVRYFGTKAGLLQALFEESWWKLNRHIAQALPRARNGRAAVMAILAIVIDAFGRDADLAAIFLLEGRRVRGAAREVVLTRGFEAFLERLRQLVVRGQKDGSFRKDLPPAAVVSALVGAAEGLIRDRLLARRSGRRPYTARQIHETFEAMLNGFARR